jgi:uncharacterized protein (TIGR02246 family)
MRSTPLLALAAFTLLPACEKGGSPQEAQATVTDTAADDQAIRASIRRWHELIQSKDAEAIAMLFADEGIVMPPGQPSVSGREALRKFWQSTVDMRDLKLTFEPERIDFARGGDIAIDRGTYRFQGKVDGQSLDESGKYIVIWKKIGEHWQVVSDIWNSSQPPAAA